MILHNTESALEATKTIEAEKLCKDVARNVEIICLNCAKVWVKQMGNNDTLVRHEKYETLKNGRKLLACPLCNSYRLDLNKQNYGKTNKRRNKRAL